MLRAGGKRKYKNKAVVFLFFSRVAQTSTEREISFSAGSQSALIAFARQVPNQAKKQHASANYRSAQLKSR